jgi:putative oxidoreductase
MSRSRTHRTSVIADLGLLALRGVVGGYVAGHGAQKLFGALDGPGLDAAGEHFESEIGLTPGKPMAALAAGSELAGGALTAAGLANPLGPMAIIGTMGVAADTAHRGSGPFTEDGGPELPLTNLAAATAVGLIGPGRFSLDWLFGFKVSRATLALAFVGGVAAAAYAVSQKRIAEMAVEEPEPAPVDAPMVSTSTEFRRTA